MTLRMMLLALFLLIGGRAAAADEFDAVKCGADIPRALIGRHSPNGPTAATEARHRDLALKGIGGDMVTDDINMVDWSICGREFYVLLDRHDMVRDVLAFPAHSSATPAFSSGGCDRDGRKFTDADYAVLDNRAGAAKVFDPNDATMLPVLWAWGIDEKAVKFVKLDVAGVRCPLSGIDEVDRVRR